MHLIKEIIENKIMALHLIIKKIENGALLNELISLQAIRLCRDIGKIFRMYLGKMNTVDKNLLSYVLKNVDFCLVRLITVQEFFIDPVQNFVDKFINEIFFLSLYLLDLSKNQVRVLSFKPICLN